MQKKEQKTFLCEYIHEEARKELASFSEIVDDWNRIDEVEALINRNLKIDAAVMDRAKNLKLIVVHGTGLDGVDLLEAKRRGIKVVSTPHRNARSVAELNVALMLAAARKFSVAEKRLESGADMGSKAVVSSLQGVELSEKTVAFLGVGEIARQTAAICKHGFSMQINGWSRSFSSEKAEAISVRYCETIGEAVANADFVVLGMALCEETRGMIGKAVFDQMKPGAILINTTRGAVIDQDALYVALTSGKLSGAALDVLADEPVTKEHPLQKLENVLITPHIGANTEDALYRVGMACVEHIRAYMCEQE